MWDQKKKKKQKIANSSNQRLQSWTPSMLVVVIQGGGVGNKNCLWQKNPKKQTHKPLLRPKQKLKCYLRQGAGIWRYLNKKITPLPL